MGKRKRVFDGSIYGSSYVQRKCRNSHVKRKLAIFKIRRIEKAEAGHVTMSNFLAPWLRRKLVQNTMGRTEQKCKSRRKKVYTKIRGELTQKNHLIDEGRRDWILQNFTGSPSTPSNFLDFSVLKMAREEERKNLEWAYHQFFSVGLWLNLCSTTYQM